MFPSSVFDQEAVNLSANDIGEIPEGDPGEDARWRTFEKDGVRLRINGDPPHLEMVVTQRLQNDTWVYSGSGDCDPVAYRENRAAVYWAVDNESPPSAEDATFDVMATDVQCASGHPADERVGEAEVLERQDAVIVTFTATRLKGFQNCPGHSSARRSITLTRPLGTRRLLDGTPYPPQPPCTADEPAGRCNAFYEPSAESGVRST